MKYTVREGQQNVLLSDFKWGIVKECRDIQIMSSTIINAFCLFIA